MNTGKILRGKIQRVPQVPWRVCGRSPSSCPKLGIFFPEILASVVTGQHRCLLTSISLCLPLSVQVEKRLELVKQVSHSTHKKLTACLQGQQGAEADKRSVSTLCRAQAA